MGNKEFGFDLRGLDQLEKKVKELSGTNQVGLSELFSARFMQKNTSFGNVVEMFEKSGLGIESREDIENNQKAWNEFIKTNTNYAGWEQMLRAASEEWIKRQLGF